MRALDPTKSLILLALLVVLGVPFLFRPDTGPSGNADRRVVIITPHNEQIRTEFGRAFSAWHEREYGESAEVVWVTPGGTSEIRRQLQSVYSKAIKDGQLLPDGSLAEGVPPMAQDLLFGGGTYEHGQMKRGVQAAVSSSHRPLIALVGTALESHFGAIDNARVSEIIDCLASDCYETTPGPDIDLFQGLSREHVLEEIAGFLDEQKTGIASLEFRVREDADGTPQAPEVVITQSISVPITYWSESELASLYGPNFVGPERNTLYDPERFWLGTATSGFGIVYNRDILAELGVDEPAQWEDFGDPRLRSWVALADPRQSGSVATLYDSILNNKGWDAGWRILREMCANARYFSNSSPKVPLDVSQGQAAIGVCIDFYGRYQAQSVMREGETPETSRVGYVDPPGAVFIDPDPITLLRAGPDPETAQRFVAFVLSDEGQALWQFHARGDDAPDSGAQDPESWGPERFELRRMPVRRDFIASHMDRLVDRVDPFAIAAPTTSRGWRSSVSPMMAAFGIETHGELVRAWEALNAARADDSFPADALHEMERLFYAMPEHTFPDGTVKLFRPETYREIRNTWRDATQWREAKIAYRAFFKRNYERVVELRRNPQSASTDGHL